MSDTTQKPTGPTIEEMAMADSELYDVVQRDSVRLLIQFYESTPDVVIATINGVPYTRGLMVNMIKEGLE